jgi:hypothetical protein
MDKKLYLCSIFDLKKVFDTVDHSILLRKLQHYGIRGTVNEWFSSYLIDRYQVMQVGLYISNKAVPKPDVLLVLLSMTYKISDNEFLRI